MRLTHPSAAPPCRPAETSTAVLAEAPRAALPLTSLALGAAMALTALLATAPAFGESTAGATAEAEKATVAEAAPAGDAAGDADWPFPPVTTFTLENGMQAIVIEDNRVPVVTHMVWYKVGAADEPWGKSGIAHFFEHLMFKGTDKIPEGGFSKVVAQNGGQDNAFTSWDYTAYFQRIASDRLGIVMGMEADRMKNLRINDDLVATERDVILEERNSRTDNDPSNLFGEQLRAALYLNHPYGVPIIGWRHEIEELNLKDAKAFYDRFYAPDNAVLVVAGDVDPAEVRALAEEHYGPLAPSGRPPEARPSEPPQLAPRRLAMSDPRVRQPYVIRYYKVPAYGPGTKEDAAALSILADVLADGKTSRFTQALEFGDGPAVGSSAWYIPTAKDTTTFGIYAASKPGRTLDEVEEALDAELARIAAEGPTAAELERVKRKARANHLYSLDNQSGLARTYGNAAVLGLSVEDLHSWPELMNAVTAEDVKRVASELLRIEASVTGRLTQSEEKAG
ncbi:MAG: pitrilysin family protein [Pseudomonadota bacterium]